MIPKSTPIYSYTYTLRSRYGETDQMGYVYYGRYLEYFEVARTEMVRSLGLPYSRLEKDGIMLPVVETAIKYKAPIFYDELMKITVSVHELPTVKLQTYYKIHTDRRSAEHAFGFVTLCFMERESRRPCRAPAYFNEKLRTAGGIHEQSAKS